MRISRPAAAVALTAAAFAVGAAQPQAVPGSARHQAAPERPGDRVAEQRPRAESGRKRPEPAACNAWTEGSRAIASCFNPNPEADRVQLHVECDRWWDPDMDGAAFDLGPAQHVRLTQRCWKEIREAWVSHRPLSSRR